MIWQDIKSSLSAPFHPDEIKWRPGMVRNNRGLVFAFVDARTVIERLDEVCEDNWQNRYTLATGDLLICEIGLNLSDQWVWRANGAGGTEVEEAKGKASDAFKRAAVMWGIGKYLYHIPGPLWVDLDKGKYISDMMKKELTERLALWQEKTYGSV